MAKPLEKQWYDIVTPQYFGAKVVGRTLTTVPERLIGKVIETSLAEMTGEISKYYIKLYFKTDKVEGSRVSTAFFGHECTRDFIARVVQPRTDRIDTMNIVTTKDGKIIIKTITITNRSVSNGTQKNIQKTVENMVKEEFKNITTEDFLKSMITGTIQKKIRKEVGKLYPLRQFEFIKSKVI